MNDTIENVPATETDAAISAEPIEDERLIKYLKGLYPKDPRRQDRAALANLRRGLGKPPKSVMEMYPYLGQFLSSEPRPRYESAIFIVAALFAYYPDAPGNIGNLGTSLRELSDRDKKNRLASERVSKSLERRFVVLLNAEADDLPHYLRQIVGLLKSAEKPIPINWNQLFKDIQNWNHDARFVQKKWAEKFWAYSANEKNQDKQNNSGETN